MTTQLATDLQATAPLQSKPHQVCPVRDRCMVTTRVDGDRPGRPIVIEQPRSTLGIPCGFELVGTVRYCHKRKKLRVGPIEVEP